MTGQTVPGAIVCVTGVSPVGRSVYVDPGAINNELVLENDVVFGSVNAARRHYDRRAPLADWSDALERRKDDVKVVIDLA